MIGIYQIINLVDGKRYVGSSQSVEHRFVCHKSMLENKRHTNIYLQRAWDKYGAENFQFDVIQELDTKEDLISAEQDAMDRLNVLDKSVGYNIVPYADRRELSQETKEKIGIKHRGKVVSDEVRLKYAEASRNKRHTSETRAKMSASATGRVTPESVKEKLRNHFCKPIVQYDLQGKEVNTFRSIRDAVRKTGFTRSNISKAVNGRVKTSHGYIWKEKPSDLSGQVLA